MTSHELAARLRELSSVANDSTDVRCISASRRLDSELRNALPQILEALEGAPASRGMVPESVAVRAICERAGRCPLGDARDESIANIYLARAKESEASRV